MLKCYSISTLFLVLAVVEAVALAHGHVVFLGKVIVLDAFVERMNGVIKPRDIFKMNGRLVDFGDSVFASAPVNYGSKVGCGWVVDRDPKLELRRVLSMYSPHWN